MSDNERRAALVAVPLANGRTAVTGATYGAQVVMKANHGEYDGSTKMWTFPTVELANAAVAETVALMRRAKEPLPTPTPSPAAA